MVWLGQKKPNAATIKSYSDDERNNKLCPGSTDLVYSMTALIGIRNNNNERWALYPFNLQQATCYNSKDKVLNVLGQYYFENMKEHSWNVSKEYLNDNYGGKIRYDLEKKKYKQDGKLILKNFGYNLHDEGFWDKSLIWQKGAVLKDYYMFELAGNAGQPYELPELVYPKEIIELYE